jgi:hypothetical protein
MTREEAEKKLCPYAMATYQCHHEGAMCVTVNCMAWQKQQMRETDNSVVVTYSETLGYCKRLGQDF